MLTITTIIMTIKSCLRSCIFLLLLIIDLQSTSLAKEDINILDRPADHIGTVFHVGLWVEDIDEMLQFLDKVMDFNIVLRAERSSGGERVILSDSRGQNIELLSDPENVKAHPEFPLHPQGRVAGIAHISIWVEDVIILKNSLRALGYEILGQVPEDYTDGYVSSNDKMYRILFVQGPGAVTFEFFEINN
jgi:catechol 2,3-dioxygenase-like lactoylglutathione lyase family enzyme